MKKKKNILIAMLCFILLSQTLIVFADDDENKNSASSVHEMIYMTEDGKQMVFEKIDKLRTSKIYYTTLGMTISRCEANSSKKSPSGEFVGIDFATTVIENRKEEIPIDNGYQITRRYFDYDSVLAEIRAVSEDWYNEIVESKTDVYVLFDAIMITVNDASGVGPEGTIDPNGNIPNNFVGKIYWRENWNPGLLNAYGWADKSVIKTNFNKPFLFRTVEPEDVQVEKPTTTTMAPAADKQETIGKEKPAYDTYNTSSKYDLSKGIPTTEEVTNGVNIDTWYGLADIGKHTYTCDPNMYKTKYDIKVKHTRSWYSSTTHSRHSYSWYTHTTGYHSPTRTATCYYVMDTDLYEFIMANVKNRVYESDHLFNNIYPFAFDIKINGIEYQTGTTDSITDWYPKEVEHVKWAVSDKSTVNVSCDEGGEDGAKREAINIIEGRVKKPVVMNDRVKIMVNGSVYTYLDDTPCDLNSSSGPIAYKKVNETDYQNQNQTQTQKIPMTLANGPYETSMRVQYKEFAGKLVGSTSNSTYSGSGKSIISSKPEVNNPHHPTRALTTNEPVYVHSPVISPVKIYDKDGNDVNIDSMPSQLIHRGNKIDGYEYVNYELRLDEKYIFKFEPGMHREDAQNYGWGDLEKYDKYKLDKQVKFPFAVKIKDIYYNVRGDGYTEWIQADNITEFYIPSWSQEGIYTQYDNMSEIYNYYKRPIEYRVLANNTFDSDGNSHLDDTQYETNKDINKYVAYFDIPVEVSGWIYNFQAVGIDDADKFNYAGAEADRTKYYAFVPEKEEKKSGTLNRIGGKSVRYSKDGDITNDWSLSKLLTNTLPFTTGRSNYNKNMGVLDQGTTIYYTVKTIANLGDSNEDAVEIKPTWRWVSDDGVVKDNIKVCFNTGTDKWIEADSVNDEMRKISMGDIPFKGAYFDYRYDTLKYTADKQSITSSNLLQRETECYNFGHIILNSDLRLLTGNEEELNSELGNNAAATMRYKNADGSYRFNDMNDIVYDSFQSSMQTWYGAYKIPAHMFICDSSINIYEYAKEHNGISEDDDIWIKNGYLVLNFSITTKNNGNDHLAYSATTSDQWDKESGWTSGENPKEIKIGNDITNPKIKIPARPGDVAIIDKRSSRADDYDTMTFIIN